MAGSFDFARSFTVEAGPARVAAVLADLAAYPSWWPQVRAVASLASDRALVKVRSTLPYVLWLELTRLREEPDELVVRIDGALSGTASWRLVAVGERTRLDFAQHVEVLGTGIRVATVLARPVLEWNHERMMRGCEAGLRRRLAEPAAG